MTQNGGLSLSLKAEVSEAKKGERVSLLGFSFSFSSFIIWRQKRASNGWLSRAAAVAVVAAPAAAGESIQQSGSGGLDALDTGDMKAESASSMVL